MGMEVLGFDPGGKPERLMPEAQARGNPHPPRLGGAGSAAKPAQSEQEIQEALHTLEQGFQLFNHRLQFSVNREINRIVVKVIDRTTDKVIKEIPPEEIQHMAAKMREMVGLLVDEKI